MEATLNPADLLTIAGASIAAIVVTQFAKMLFTLTRRVVRIVALVTGLILVAAAIGPMLIVGAKLVKAFQAIKTAFIAVQLVMAANPFILLAIAVAAIAFLIFKNWDKILAFLKAVWEKIKEVFDAAIDFLVAAIKTILD
ncbi:hypothetical protein LCGC14_2028840 [marine sediment metagenome]|uniref:Uncharacterized protein n=1 Tax=marine sediment metagenome TaxID=412755 RepID=A0A0F9HSE3_9ZZZZ